MLAVACAERNLLRHVIRAPEVYLVPRTDGRIVIGSTLEEAGYDKRTDADTIHRLHQAAIHMVPALAQARFWSPGPAYGQALGRLTHPGCHQHTGILQWPRAFRGGILLTPVTAQVMAGDHGRSADYDISGFLLYDFTLDQSSMTRVHLLCSFSASSAFRPQA
jgi:glycine oxidase